MISVTTAVANEINKLSRRWSAKLLKVSDSSEIVCDIKSIVIHKGACGTFAVGSVFIPYIEMEVFGNPTIDSEFKLQLGIDVSGTINYIDMGYFTVTSYKETTNTIKYVAQGRLYEMGKEVLYESESSALYLSDIIDDVEDAGYNVIYKNGLTLPSVQIKTGFQNISCRDAVQIVATCVGGFVTEDNAGNICLCKYNECETADLTIDGDRSTSEPEILGEYTVNGCRVRVSSSLVFEESDANLEVTNPYFNDTMWSNYKNNLTGLTFECTNAKVTLGDPRLEAWDCVKITDNNDVDHMVPCLTLTWTFKGGLTMNLDATATLPVDEGSLSGGPLTKALEELSDATDSIASTVEASAMDVNVLYDITAHTRQVEETVNVVPPHSVLSIQSDDVIMSSLLTMYGSTFRGQQIIKPTNATNWNAVGGASISGSVVSLPVEGEIVSRYYTEPLETPEYSGGTHWLVMFKYRCNGAARIHVYSQDEESAFYGYWNGPTVIVEGNGEWQTCCQYLNPSSGSHSTFGDGWVIHIGHDYGSSASIEMKDVQIVYIDGAWYDCEPNDFNATRFLNCFEDDVYFDYGYNEWDSAVDSIVVTNYFDQKIAEYEIPSDVYGQSKYGTARSLVDRVNGYDSRYPPSYIDFESDLFCTGGDPSEREYIYLDLPEGCMQRLRSSIDGDIHINFVQSGRHKISPLISLKKYVPFDYLKNASVSGNTLTITKGDGTEVEFTPSGGGEPNAYIKDASASGNTLTLTKKDDSTVAFTPTGLVDYLSVVNGEVCITYEET